MLQRILTAQTNGVRLANVHPRLIPEPTQSDHPERVGDTDYRDKVGSVLFREVVHQHVVRDVKVRDDVPSKTEQKNCSNFYVENLPRANDLPDEQQQRRDGHHAELELEEQRKVEHRLERVDEALVPCLWGKNYE